MDATNGSNGTIVGLLERIAARLDSIDARIDAMDHRLDGRIDGTNSRIDALRLDMNRGFTQVNARIDNVLAIAGGHHDDHEQRIQVLEEQVLGKSGSR